MASVGITFEVSPVTPGELAPALDVTSSVTSLLGKRVEAIHCAATRLVACDTQHPFAKAAHDAFYNHLPLVIRPDDVWFCIAQGFAHHINLNAESLRERFVRHAGREPLLVERPDFILGQPNPWPEVFAAFSIQIGEHVGKLQSLIAARFSTSTPVEVAAFDVALMDSFQGYFEYRMSIGCGIPQITLLGTPADWASMIPRVQQFAEYGLEPWTRALRPILDAIIDTASGHVDQDFWYSMFRHESRSGAGELTGWIHTLFPYLIVDWQTGALGPNPYLTNWHERYLAGSALRGGPDIGDLPSGLVSAPVRCVDPNNTEHALRFVAGMFGVEQDPITKALAPAFGWAVVYDD